MGAGENNALGTMRLGRNQDAFDRFSAAVELAAIDYTVWALFALEYLTELYLFPKRRTFVRRHIMDLLMVVIPFLRPVRLRRVTRLGRFGLTVQRTVDRAQSVVSHQGLHFVLPTISVTARPSATWETDCGGRL